MSNFVFVLDAKKQLLDPIPPGMARWLLKQEKAAVYRKYPFTIILKYTVPEPKTKPLQLKLDPGSKKTGIALVQENKLIWGAELQHRGQQIRVALLTRSQVRRSRRNRKTRYRKPRFLNRARPKGWLAPSLQHRVETTLTWVNRLRRLAPITGMSQELVKFDTQLMQNPEISGTQYQQGELAGYECREYLLEKFNRTCIYCGAINVKLEIEHLTPKSRGGSNRISNLAIACHKCNQNKGNQTVQEFAPTLAIKILASAKQPLKDAAVVNSTRSQLFNRLKETGLPIETGTGGKTKYNRIQLNLSKSHVLDAACVGVIDQLQILTSQPLLVVAKGWGNRQMSTTNKYGFPIRHKTRCKTFFGFQTGDIVRAILPTGKFAGTHVGRLTVRATGVFEMVTNMGKVSPVRHKYCTALHRNDGYNYAFSSIWSPLNQ